MVDYQDFTFSLLCSKNKIAEHLEALARSIRDGDVQLESGKRKLHLKPENEIDFFLKAYRQGTRNKISFDIRWTNRPDTMMELNIGGKASEDSDESDV